MSEMAESGWIEIPEWATRCKALVFGDGVTITFEMNALEVEKLTSTGVRKRREAMR